MLARNGMASNVMPTTISSKPGPELKQQQQQQQANKLRALVQLKTLQYAQFGRESVPCSEIKWQESFCFIQDETHRASNNPAQLWTKENELLISRPEMRNVNAFTIETPCPLFCILLWHDCNDSVWSGRHFFFQGRRLLLSWGGSELGWKTRGFPHTSPVRFICVNRCVARDSSFV